MWISGICQGPAVCNNQITEAGANMAEYVRHLSAPGLQYPDKRGSL